MCALLKKGKPEKELQASMQEQLDVFLGAETQPFLERLMDTLRTEEYLKTPLPIADPSIAASETIGETTSSSSSQQPLRDSSSPPLTHSQTKEPPVEHSSSQRTIPSDDDALRIDHTPSGGGHSPIKAPLTDASCPSSAGSASSRRQQRLSARSRSRSRSRSPDRRVVLSSSRPSRDSRDRLNRPSHRNKSPPGRRGFENRDHRGSGRGSKGSVGGGYNNRRNHSRSRSRSHSPPAYHGKSSRSLSPVHNNNNNAGEGETRIQSQVVVQKGKKCRDFEEKGYCMRGETCPWDHGIDPVVLEDINNPTLMTIQQQQQHLREYNPDAPDLWSRNNQGGFGPRGPMGVGPRNGVDFHGGPQHQRLPFRLSSGQVVGGMVPHGLNRELIPVPVMMDGQPVGMHHPMDGMMTGGGGGGGPKRRYEDQNQPLVPGGGSMEGPPKRRPLAGRLGGRMGGPVQGGGGPGGPGGPMGQQNCSLELRKVPRGLNSIAHLNNHFSKFGKIINIQVNYENDPEAAIVTFSCHAEANVAYRSTEAVLNNRFIKVFWHNSNKDSNGKEAAAGGDGGKEDQGQGQGQHQGGRKPNQYHLNNVLKKQEEKEKKEREEAGTGGEKDQGGANPGSAAAVPAVVASPGQLRLRMNNNRQVNRRKQEEQVKAVQMAQDLMKKKHDLLQEYLKQMRSCLDLIEKLDAQDPQRAKLLATLKELQSSIDKLRKEIAEDQKQLTAAQQGLQQQEANHPQAVMRMTKEQQQKELLDLELELIAQQQEGNDTTHIQKRILELQRALARAGVPFQRNPNVGGGQGGVGGRGRVAPPGSTSVDRRPTTIFVAGFKVEDSDALLGHFKVS